MKYLLVLNRFEIDKNKLKQKIGAFQEDYGIIVENLKNSGLNEVEKIYILIDNWKRLNFNQLKSDVFKGLSFVNGRSFFARTKFYSKIPISSRSIIKKVNSLMKKENISYMKDGEIEYFIQFKKDPHPMYRVLVRKNLSKATKFDLKKFSVVLEKPGSVIEISDFIRVCWIFKLPLTIIADDDKKFRFLLNKAKKMTKGVPYENFNMKIMKEFPKSYVKVGFSIKAKLDETDLIEVLNEDNIALVFGDEKFGLSQKGRDECNYLVRLTPEKTKPLRASQALTYVLGFYNRKLIEG